MSDYIKVTLAPGAAQVDPGESVEAAIAVRNASNIVDVFSIEVTGLPEGWPRLSVATVSLFPGDQASCTLTVSPPRESGAKAQTYPFTVRVVSRKDPTQATSVEGTLDVRPYHAFEASLSPAALTGARGAFSLKIANSGNAEAKFDLEASDQKKQFIYSFDPAHPKVEAGRQADVRVMVEARERPLRTPAPPAQFQVQVALEQSDAAPQAVAGVFTATPRLPKWAVPSALGALLVLVVALAVFVFVQTRQDWDVDRSYPFMDKQVSATVPSYIAVDFDMPTPQPATVDINAVWRTGGPDSMSIVLVNPETRCLWAEERPDGDSAEFNLDPSNPRWEDPCTDMDYVDLGQWAGQWVVIMENYTDFQARDVRVQLAFDQQPPTGV
jgi:hypothetical protein